MWIGTSKVQNLSVCFQNSYIKEEPHHNPCCQWSRILSSQASIGGSCWLITYAWPRLLLMSFRQTEDVLICDSSVDSDGTRLRWRTWMNRLCWQKKYFDSKYQRKIRRPGGSLVQYHVGCQNSTVTALRFMCGGAQNLEIHELAPPLHEVFDAMLGLLFIDPKRPTD